MDFDGDLMRFDGDLMRFCGDLMGFDGDLMGFTRNYTLSHDYGLNHPAITGTTHYLAMFNGYATISMAMQQIARG